MSLRVIQSGLTDGKTIQKLLATATMVATFYGTYLGHLESSNKEKLEEATKAGQNLVEQSRVETNNLRDQLANEKTKNLISQLQLGENFTKANNLVREMSDTLEKSLKFANTSTALPGAVIKSLLDSQFSALKIEMSEAEKFIQSLERQATLAKQAKYDEDAKVSKSDIDSDVKESSVLPSFLKDYFDSQGFIGQLSISLLISNYVLFTSIVSIVSILYGEYLIKKFNLETRHV